MPLKAFFEEGRKCRVRESQRTYSSSKSHKAASKLI
jgi:hypothetical protein